MTRQQIHQTITEFVAYVTQPGKKSDEELLKLIDKLMYAREFALFTVDDQEYPDPSVPPYDEVRALISKHFPDYGFYNRPEFVTSHEMTTPLLAGDAIDDLTDACRGFMESLARWNANSPEDGLWYFDFGYKSHWGQHLRNLQYYVSARIVEGTCD